MSSIDGNSSIRFGSALIVRCVVASIWLASTCALSYSANGTAYPIRPIHVVIPWAVGGGPDLVTRVTITELEKRINQGIVIENKPGANSVTGTFSVAVSPPDGYTLLSANTSFSLNPSTHKTLPYNSLKDFIPVSGIAHSSGYLLLVNAKSNIKTVKELLDLAKTKQIFYGSAGLGNTNHLAAALLAYKSGVPMTHIPYPGIADALQGILTGEVTFAFMTMIAAAPRIESGEMRAIGFTGNAPLKDYPDAPPISITVPGYELGGPWAGILAPKGTPDSVVTYLNERIGQTLQSGSVMKSLDEVGYDPFPGSPQEFGGLIQQEMQIWAEAAKAANLEPQ